MTPDAEIFHVATGFLSPKDLANEAQFAAELFRQLRKGPATSDAVVVDSHLRRLLDEGFLIDEINTTNPLMAMARSGGNTRRGSQRMPNGADPLRQFIRQQFLEDQKFPMKYPLLDYDLFETSPEMLVGNGKSFFASSSSGSNR